MVGAPVPTSVPGSGIENGLSRESKAFNLLLEDRNRPDSFFESAHFVLFSDLKSGELDRSFSALENTLQKFKEFARFLDYPISDLSTKLVGVFFNEREDYTHFALNSDHLDFDQTRWMAGYFNVERKRIVFSTKGLNARRSTKESNFIVSHEATHLLTYSTNFLSSTISTPFWLNEGLAMQLEDENVLNYFDIGIINRKRMEEFESLFKDGNWMPLQRFLGIFMIEEEFSDQEVRDLYAQAYGLTRWLLKHKQAAFKNYLETLRFQQKGLSTPDHLEIFENSFGPIADVEAGVLGNL